jgi:hypothetical protein
MIIKHAIDFFGYRESALICMSRWGDDDSKFKVKDAQAAHI